MTVELTEEQKKCVEYPLSKQILLIDADPGTGKTEILRHRVKFIYQQNEKQRKFILVLAVGRNISKSIKRKLKAEGLKKIHNQLRTVLPEFVHKLCKQNDCLECEERKKPIILTCTVHSIAYWIVKQIFARQLQEKKKIQILTNAWNKDLSLIYQSPDYPKLKEKIHWTVKEVITKQRRIFSYLLNKIAPEKLTKETRKELWIIFRQEVQINREVDPYYHWNIANYSGFLDKVKNFFFEKEESFYQALEKACSADKEKNVWLSFEDMIENVLLFARKQNSSNYWPIFDYILVDECQDLKINLLTLITEIFSHQRTSFTFVGDPKQNIMAFAGATEDVFKLLKKKFPDCVQMEIAISFRVPQEIAQMANDFTSKFMPYNPKLTTNQTNGGKKPVIFLAGEENNYQLTSHEEDLIKKKVELVFSEENWSKLSLDKKEKKLQSLQKKLNLEEIKTKKLKNQVNFILSKISKLDKSASRAILYRKNEIGNWLKNWFVITNYHDFTMMGDDFNRTIKHIINKIKKELKDKPFSASKFNSIEDFLANLGVNWKNIPKFQQLIEKFERARFLSEREENQNLSEEEVSEFILQIDKQLIKIDIENTGKTVLSTIHKAKGLEFDYVFLIAVDEEVLPSKSNRSWEEVNLFYTAITRAKNELYLTASCQEKCSRFIRNLNPNLVELVPTNSQLLQKKDNINYSHLLPYCSSISEIIGERGEMEILELLMNNKKIKFEKLSKNWEEIEDLQIDIYAETSKSIYFIEVKNWSDSFYYSPKEGFFRQQKIWEQQTRRKGKIVENFNSAKNIIYLVSFPNGEIANDFREFLVKKQEKELLVVHHDQVYGKIWDSEYSLKKIDDFIYEKEKTSQNKKKKC